MKKGTKEVILKTGGKNNLKKTESLTSLHWHAQSAALFKGIFTQFISFLKIYLKGFIYQSSPGGETNKQPLSVVPCIKK